MRPLQEAGNAPARTGARKPPPRRRRRSPRGNRCARFRKLERRKPARRTRTSGSRWPFSFRRPCGYHFSSSEHVYLSDRGRIAPGLRADLLLVRGDPTNDIKSTRDIVTVWKLGVKVDRVTYHPGSTK